MNSPYTIAVLETVIGSLRAHNDLKNCGMEHEWKRGGIQCVQSVADSRVGCPHATVDILETALRAMGTIGVVSAKQVKKHAPVLQDMFERLGLMDDVVYGTSSSWDVDEIPALQAFIIRHRDRYRRALICLAERAFNT